MKNFFSFGAVLVLLLFALMGYWHLNPHHAPAFWRATMPKVEVRGPTTPMIGFTK